QDEIRTLFPQGIHSSSSVSLLSCSNRYQFSLAERAAGSSALTPSVHPVQRCSSLLTLFLLLLRRVSEGVADDPHSPMVCPHRRRQSPGAMASLAPGVTLRRAAFPGRPVAPGRVRLRQPSEAGFLAAHPPQQSPYLKFQGGMYSSARGSPGRVSPPVSDLRSP